MKKFYLIGIAMLCFTGLHAQVRKIAVIGSSTTSGSGAWPLDSSWLNRLNYYYKDVLHKCDTIYTHGVGGYPCYKGMPTTYKQPPGYDAPDPNNNISMAINKLKGLDDPANGTIIINYPSNKYPEYNIAEIMFCLQTMYDSAVAAGHKCFITTTQPRNDGVFTTSAVKRKLSVIKDSIINRFGEAHTLNFWDGMINPADSSTRTDLAASDNIHFNNEGHRELFFRTVAKDVLGLTATAPLPVTIEQFNASITNTGVALKWTAHHDDPHSWFVVQRSVNGLPYESLAKIEVNNMGGGRKNYGYKDETAQSGTNFYRLEIHEAARTYYSAVLPVKIQSAGLVIKKIYPTRVISTLTLDVISPEVRSATLELFSSDGTRLKVLTRRLNRDKNTISIPVAGLSRGTYFVRISSPGIAPVIQSFQK